MILSPFREYEPFAGRLLILHPSLLRVLVVFLEHVDAFWPSDLSFLTPVCSIFVSFNSFPLCLPNLILESRKVKGKLLLRVYRLFAHRKSTKTSQFISSTINHSASDPLSLMLVTEVHSSSSLPDSAGFPILFPTPKSDDWLQMKPQHPQGG